MEFSLIPSYTKTYYVEAGRSGLTPPLLASSIKV